MSRMRDAKGMFLPSTARDTYGGFQECTTCLVTKECTPENFRVNTCGGKISLVCRACTALKGKALHDSRKNDPEYLAKRRASGKKYREKNREIGLLNNYKRIDEKRGLTNDLTLEVLFSLVSRPCTYCGDMEKIGRDRINNDEGHSQGNVVPCCPQCNKARSDFFSVEEMREFIGPAIQEAKKRRVS